REPFGRAAREELAHAGAAAEDLANIAGAGEERAQPGLGRPALRPQGNRRGQLRDQRVRKLERVLRRLFELPAADERESRVDPLDQVVERGTDLRVGGAAAEETEQHASSSPSPRRPSPPAPTWGFRSR